MSFEVKTLLGAQALVSGTDSIGNEGKTLVSTSEWDELKARLGFSAATEDFNAVVTQFFAPLTEASEKLEIAGRIKEQNPLEYVVIKKGVDSIAGETAEIARLSKDSMILRLIEEDKTDLLIWVDESTLGVLDTA